MTTSVTEAVKRPAEGSDSEELKTRPINEICDDPTLARRLGRILLDAAKASLPGREWTLEDLREVLEVAINGPPTDRAQTLEGRYFRKRLREQYSFAERYGEPFACIVISLAAGHSAGSYSAVLDGVVESLRRADMVFLYKRRLAIILPRMRRDATTAFVERLRKVVESSADPASVEAIEWLACPDPAYQDMDPVLDWAEDRLRDI